MPCLQSNTAFPLLLAFTLLVPMSTWAETESTTGDPLNIEHRVMEMRDETDAVIARVIREHYAESLQPRVERLHEEEDAISYKAEDDIEALFEAVRASVVYTNSAEIAKDLEALFRVLDEAGRAPEGSAQAVHELLFTVRSLDRLERFFEDHSDRIGDELPSIRDADERTGLHPGILRMRDGGKRLDYEEVVPGKEIDLVIVSHPGCGFSRQAMDYILDDPELAEWIGERGLWLLPQRPRPSLDRSTRGIRSGWAVISYLPIVTGIGRISSIGARPPSTWFPKMV